MALPPHNQWVLCGAPGCYYSTPRHANLEEALDFLKLHVDTAHQREQVAPQLVTKIYKLFEDHWERYKRATERAEQILLDNLWSKIETELFQPTFDQGNNKPRGQGKHNSGNIRRIDPTTNNLCSYCGGIPHKGPRKIECRAYNQICNKCLKKGIVQKCVEAQTSNQPPPPKETYPWRQQCQKTRGESFKE